MHERSTKEQESVRFLVMRGVRFLASPDGVLLHHIEALQTFGVHHKFPLQLIEIKIILISSQLTKFEKSSGMSTRQKRR